MTTRDGTHTSETLASAGRRPAGATLERLVNAVIRPGFSGRTVPQWLEAALRRGLAGVAYFSQNIDPDDPARLPRLPASIR